MKAEWSPEDRARDTLANLERYRWEDPVLAWSYSLDAWKKLSASNARHGRLEAASYYLKLAQAASRNLRRARG